MRTFEQIARMIFVATATQNLNEHGYHYWVGFVKGRKERKAPPKETEHIAQINRLFAEGCSVDQIADAIDLSLESEGQMAFEGWSFPDRIDPDHQTKWAKEKLLYLNGLGLDLTLDELLFYNFMILAEAMRLAMLE